METPKVSIVVPIYNAEQYLQKCIDSLLRQGLKDYELLLVNDGSTDSSLSICQSYADQYDHIKILNQINSGVCAARNFGIQSASGEWIVLVDSDDYLLDNGLATVISVKRALPATARLDACCNAFKEVLLPSTATTICLYITHSPC